MNRILKLLLPPAGPGMVRTGPIARWLAVAFQGQHLVAWVEAEAGDTVETQVYVARTGEAAPVGGSFVGTAQYAPDTQPYVVHVYVEPTILPSKVPGLITSSRN